MKKRPCSTEEIIAALTQVELGLPLTGLIRQLLDTKDGHSDPSFVLCGQMKRRELPTRS